MSCPTCRIFAALVGCYFALFAVAAKGEPSVARLWRLSGLEQQIAHIPDAVVDGFGRSAKRHFEGRENAKELTFKITTSLRQNFAFERLAGTIRSHLHSELSTDELAMIIAWHESGLGRKIVALETQRSALVAAEQRREFLLTLNEKDLAGNRAEALRSLDAALKLTESSVSMMLDMQVAMTAISLRGQFQDKHTDLQKLRAYFSRQRQSLQNHYADESLRSMLFVYDGLSVEQLQRYREFALTSAGSSYVKALNQGLHKAMLQASLQLAHDLDHVLNNVPDTVL